MDNGYFETWYAELVNRFAMRRQELLNLFASELINYADYYCCLLEAIKAGALGRALVYSRRSHATLERRGLSKLTRLGNIGPQKCEQPAGRTSVINEGNISRGCAIMY